MKKVYKGFIILAILVALCVSCKRTELSVYQTLAQPYIKSNGEMGLALYIRTSVREGERLTFYVTDPSGKLSWTLDGVEVVFEDLTYIGSSDIAMPEGSMLPKGTWNVDVIYKDGRKVSQSFDVNYKDLTSVISVEEPIYDAESNLTILP